MFYENLLKTLYYEKIKFVVTGGVALVLYGVVRLTVDIDLIVSLEEENLKKFLSIIKDLGYLPKLPIDAIEILDPKKRSEWKKEKNMIVFNFYCKDKPINQIDLFIEEPIPFGEIEKEIVWFDVKDFKIPVISKRHLKFMKKISGREQDKADLEILELLEKENEKKF